MKAKALRNKETGEYLHFTYDENDCGKVVVSKYPELLDETITTEELIAHYDGTYPNVDTSVFEVIELDIIETGVLGADIRNKLSPFKNLLSMVSIYFLEKSEAKKLPMKSIIEKDIKQARKSLEYLSKLL